MTALQIRRALPSDAPGIVEVLKSVVAERIHSAIDRVWTVEQEARYLESLSHREVLHVAVDVTAGRPPACDSSRAYAHFVEEQRQPVATAMGSIRPAAVKPISAKAN